MQSKNAAKFLQQQKSLPEFSTLSMTTYKSLLQQKAELDALIAEAQKSEKAEAISQARELAEQYNLTVEDVFSKKIRVSGTHTTVAPKYRDPATGATWTGRGKAPLWIRDKNREEYAI